MSAPIDRLLGLVNDIDYLAGRQAAGLAVRDAGCEGRIERIDIHRHIDRGGYARAAASRRSGMTSIVSTPKPLELLAVMIVDRAQPDLDQAVGELFLHDAGKGRGVRARIALIGVIDVGMSVNMEDGELPRGAAAAPRRIGCVMA